MRKETERIHRIVRDLLQFSRPDQSEPTPHEPGDVELAVTETITLLRPQKSLKDVDLQVELEAPLPKVALRTSEVVQIVLNLLMNAVDAAGPRGRVRLHAREHGGGVLLAVEDDGPGVASEVLDALFEPFVTTKEVGKGTGLGLSVCRGLVESVGGKIRIDLEYLAGARFVVELPGPGAPSRTPTNPG